MVQEQVIQRPQRLCKVKDGARTIEERNRELVVERERGEREIRNGKKYSKHVNINILETKLESKYLHF